ncbi:hypothetical protein YC2023_022135 [Brassica napus]
MMVAEVKRAHSRQGQNSLFANPGLCSLSSVNIFSSSSPRRRRRSVTCCVSEVAAYHREELDVQNQRSVEEPAKKSLELCLIHSMHLILDVSANQFQKLELLNLCCYAEHDKPDSEAQNLTLRQIASLGLFHFAVPLDKGRPLPKFGEWDVNDPASAEGFTVIFNKARDEKKTGGKPGSPGKSTDGHAKSGGGGDPSKPQPKKWLCCMQSPAVDS